MGTSKAMMEKVLIAKSRQGGDKTVICGTRYGNVMASRGSVIPLFVGLINENKELTLTDPSMTRFMMTLDDAVDLVLFAFNKGTPGDIFVQKAPAVTIGDMTKALCELMGKPNYPTRVIGTRHGEKKCESLLSREEMACALDMGNYYRIPPDLRDLNYAKYVDIGEENITDASEYNSDNTERLDVEGMKLLLNKLKFIKAASKGEIIDPEE
jgi:UDP-glucose 4-epimerase